MKHASEPIFTEREIRQLDRLLLMLSKARLKNSYNEPEAYTVEATSILNAVRQWVKWFANDEMSVDL